MLRHQWPQQLILEASPNPVLLRPVTTLARAPLALWSFRLAADCIPVFLQSSPHSNHLPFILPQASWISDLLRAALVTFSQPKPGSVI